MNAIANSNSVIQGDKYRFTVLTDRLFRIEYAENGVFEDSATQTVLNRCFPKVNFKAEKYENGIKITTDYVTIYYTGGKFTKNSLTARYSGVYSANGACWTANWSYGSEDTGNLKGTARTLDNTNGAIPLEDGIISSAFAVIDDSAKMLISDDGSVIPKTTESIDFYLFGYNNDYLGALNAFYTLTGVPPMLPRFALGNWWSRYHAYTAESYLELLNKFEEKHLPFSVGVIDMDWHLTKLEPKYGTGWTGYTWNKELFPDPAAFMKKVHEKGLKISLNLHPADGVYAHEEAYVKMAEALGKDAENEEHIEFDITDEKFIDAYFKYLHHPHEEKGVDFWWLDWQQGTVTKHAGLDPLWMLNHLHYNDILRNGKRGLIFSRYSGLGSHRYPIGFSGDTAITWECLDFQPYFTVTASNAGYGWWSHDIGGHGSGTRDEELSVRWLQFGVFSPILRLHSMKNPFVHKEPWEYSLENEKIMTEFLQLRHKLIPYTYTMNKKAHEGVPLLRPIYYHYNKMRTKEFEHGGLFKNQYMFGDSLLVMPITSKADSVTQRGIVKGLLPKGIWFDFFDNTKYEGETECEFTRPINTIPVFAHAGAIIPMADLSENINNTSNPESLTVKIFPLDDGEFSMYEDDGETFEYENGHFMTTDFRLTWGKEAHLTISASGDLSVSPKKRTFNFEIVKLSGSICVTVDGMPYDYIRCGNIITVTAYTDSKIELIYSAETEKNDIDTKIFEILNNAHYDNIEKLFIWEKYKSTKSPHAFMNYLITENVDESLRKAFAEYLLM